MRGIRRFLSWAFLGIAAVVTAVLTYIFMHTYVTPNHQPMPGPAVPFVEVGSFYPVSVELQSRVGDIMLKHSVSYDLDKSVYIYHYKIKNTSDKAVLFGWDVLDFMMGDPAIIELAPEKEIVYDLERRERPTFYNGQTYFYVKDGEVWRRTVSEKQIGPMPMYKDSFIERKKQ